MLKFARLQTQLENLSSINQADEQLKLWKQYLSVQSQLEAGWAIHIMSGRHKHRAIKHRQLGSWAMESAGIPDWLFAQCFATTGDAAQTTALILPHPEEVSELTLIECLTRFVMPLAELDDDGKKDLVLEAWRTLNHEARLIYNRLISGRFRGRLNHKTLTAGIAMALGFDNSAVSLVLKNDTWDPAHGLADFERAQDSSPLKALTFASPRVIAPEKIDQVLPQLAFERCFVELPLNGMRVQIIKHDGQYQVWSEDFGYTAECFPELIDCIVALPNNTTLDGELLPCTVAAEKMRSATPTKSPDRQCTFFAFDILQHNGHDVRQQALATRRALLQEVISDLQLQSQPSQQLSLFQDNKKTPELPVRLAPFSSPLNPADFQNAIREGTQSGAHGVLIKDKFAAYTEGESTNWLLFTAPPSTLVAVALSAEYLEQGLEMTFGIWNGNKELVPIGKTLVDEDEHDIATFISSHTEEKFGPVRILKPGLVCKLTYANIEPAPRRKAGCFLTSVQLIERLKNATCEDALSVKSLLERASLTSMPAGSRHRSG